MVQFLDLPLELLPLVVQHVVRPSHLARICLVNKSWYEFTVPLLYQRVFVYAWHREGKFRVVKLFHTLAECPHLAQHVHHLEIRDFPKALPSSDYEEVLDVCLRGLGNCIHLRTCTWTRHGSLTDKVLHALCLCVDLQELEINGSHHGYYNPSMLPRLAKLRRLSLIMPSSEVIETLPRWVKITGGTLRHLTLLCKSSPLVHDGVLECIAPSLINLQQLYLVGCPKATHQGVLAILAASSCGLQALGMEGLSSTFNMTLFSKECTRLGTLNRLRSITLTVDAHHSPSWEADVLSLLAPAPLERFHISTVGGDVGPALSEDFCAAIVKAHGKRLRRFSVHRMRMSLASVDIICAQCPRLEQLFVVIQQQALEHLGPILAKAYALREVHVNRPLDLGSEDVPVLAREQILAIVKRCGPNLRQFGYNTRVFQIERDIRDEDGTLRIDRRLAPYENPEVPEQFVVVRT
ncbi:hypothetical protein WOLCODRAFT_109224 [Wolfiporia cocos MD-104 SS10]|uniref:F-box domain-containing protein n=1 Tax=Wolfiporia cocos (strain MD-104) TaxID=742152 RepID=A0A2H3JLF5_WOLCO|nr:hypothetical protein WOLCODRAFT_109224 [Wolfiporia cocos MD-104 SS10]